MPFRLAWCSDRRDVANMPKVEVLAFLLKGEDLCGIVQGGGSHPPPCQCRSRFNASHFHLADAQVRLFSDLADKLQGTTEAAPCSQVWHSAATT